MHLCHSESFEAFATGLQDALHLAGGVPRRVRSDNERLVASNKEISDMSVHQVTSSLFSKALSHASVGSRSERRPVT